MQQRLSARLRAQATRADDVGLDILAPPFLLCAVFLLLFGVGIIDSFVQAEGERLRNQLIFYRGLSLGPVLYVIAACACFVAGYYLKPAAKFGQRLRPAPRMWEATRVSVVTTISFIVTFSVLVLYASQIGYGRFEGSGEGSGALDNLSLFGELSLIPTAFSLLRYYQWRANPSRTRMSRWDRVFLWSLMLPAQLIFSVVIGVRSRVLTFLVLVLAAYHYGDRRIRPRTLIPVGAALLLVLVPLLGVYRTDSTEAISFTPRQTWESVAGRTSAVESFTVIYENLDTAPEPDPFYWTVATGVVPRFLWPGKPQSLAAERLTYWAIGRRGSWAGATLPGDLLMSFGHVGGLIAMAVLGIAWRFLVEVSRIDRSRSEQLDAWSALYLVALPSLLTVEVGFVLPYSVLIRFVLVTVLMLLASTTVEKRAWTARATVVGGALESAFESRRAFPARR